MYSTRLTILTVCLISCACALWTTDNFALDFGNDATKGAYNCGNSAYFNFDLAFTFELWIKHRWPNNTAIGHPADFSGMQLTYVANLK